MFLLFIVSIILGCLSCFYIKVNSNMDYIGFNFLFPFLFSWVRYRKKRKSALMKHYRYPKKIKIISAIFFLLVPIVICGLEIWIYGKQGWINIVY